MSYAAIFELLSGIGDQLSVTGRFKDVIVSAATDTGQMAKELEAASPPVAIVGLADVDYGDNGLSRTVRPVVVVVDTFRRGGWRRQEGVWSLAEAVEEVFTPSLNLPAGDGYKIIEGVKLYILSAVSLAGEDTLAAVAVTLEGREVL